MNTVSQPIRSDRNLAVFTGALLGLIMLLLLRRYTGIIHDATLYLGQSLMQQKPSLLAQDLFFLHGSQDRYTLFPRLLGLVFNWASPPIVFFYATLIGLLGFVAASWYCLHSLLPTNQRYWAWLSVLCLPPVYGRVSMFSLGESFLTPRIFAEALCLLSIGLLAHGYRWRAAVPITLALFLHPLQTLLALLIIWVWLVLHNRRWLLAIWLIIPVLLLAWTGLSPFNALLQKIDPAWMHRLQDNTSQLFLLSWKQEDFINLGFDFILLGLAWRLRGNFRLWSAAALTGLSLGLGCSILLVDWLQLALPTAMQPWRVHWLAHWFALAAMGALLYRDTHSADFSRGLLLLLAATLVWLMQSLLCLPLLGLYIAWPHILGRPNTQRLRLLFALLFTFGILLLLLSHTFTEFLRWKSFKFQLSLYPFDRRVLTFPLLSLGLPLCGWLIWQRITKFQYKVLLTLPLCALAVFSMLHWDARSPSTRAIEKASGQTNSFGFTLPKNAQVYWDSNLLLGPWLVLEHPSFLTANQIAGQIFNRSTAIDAGLRIDQMTPLLLDEQRCRMQPTSCKITPQSMRKACTPVTGRPHPDFLVLSRRTALKAQAHWTLSDPFSQAQIATFWLHNCHTLVHASSSAR